MVEADFPEEILLVLLPAALWTIACFFGGRRMVLLWKYGRKFQCPLAPNITGMGQKNNGEKTAYYVSCQLGRPSCTIEKTSAKEVFHS